MLDGELLLKKKILGITLLQKVIERQFNKSKKQSNTKQKQ